MVSENPLTIVDVSTEDQATADKILEGFRTQGFLFVDGHDLTQDEVDHFFALSKEFFQLPKEIKEKYAIDSNDCGYTTFNQENLDPSLQSKGDPKEAFNFGLFNFVTGDFNRDQLPEMFQYGSENYEFIRSMDLKLFKIASRILNLLAIGLKIDEDKGGAHWFSDRHRPEGTSMTSMRMLHYPATSKLDADQAVRAGAHTDYGSVTLLFQQQGEEGLELFDMNNEWKPVPFVQSPNEKYIQAGKAAPIVVNIADQLSSWTNGILKSTLHRVKLPTGADDRYSIVFFFDAENEVRLTPIPSKMVIDARPADFDPNKKDEEYITSREYSEKRFAETYVRGH
jgi:isopenicillin N synthase-like dioxygenase